MNEVNVTGVHTVGDWVITLHEGHQVGSVRDIYIDSHEKRLAGITCRKNMMSKPMWISAESIERFGEDVILVRSKDDAVEVDAEATTEGQRLSDLLGKPVITDDGRELGHLSDLELRAGDRKVTELFLKGSKHMRVDPQKLVIGEDDIIVPADEAEGLVESEASGIFERLFRRQSKKSSAEDEALKPESGEI